MNVFSSMRLHITKKMKDVTMDQTIYIFTIPNLNAKIQKMYKNCNVCDIKPFDDLNDTPKAMVVPKTSNFYTK